MSCDVEKEIAKELDALAVTGAKTAESFSRVPRIYDGKRTVKDVALKAQKKRKPRTKKRKHR